MLTAGGLLARYVEVTNHATLVLALSSPVAVLAVPVVGLRFALRRRWVLAACAAILTVVLVAILMPRPVATVDGIGVRVMSANVLQGRADPAAVVALARDHADVVSIQELTPGGLNQLSHNGIDEYFPHRITRPQVGGSGAGLWSRYPLHDIGPPSEPTPVIAGVVVPGARAAATVVVVHLSAP